MDKGWIDRYVIRQIQQNVHCRIQVVDTSVRCKIISTFIYVNISIRKCWVKNPRTRLWLDLYNNRNIGMFFLSHLFPSLGHLSLLSLYGRVASSMWPKTQALRSPQMYILWIQYQRETGQIFLLFPNPNIHEERLIDPAWVRHSFLGQSMWPGGQGCMNKWYLFRKYEINDRV